RCGRRPERGPWEGGGEHDGGDEGHLARGGRRDDDRRGRGGTQGRGVVTVNGARPTMSDVAAEAGVSLKTVSRVVNSEPGVSGSTALRVQEAIQRLGFRRNDSAR